MKTEIITLQSFTRAMQAQKALAARGIEAKVLRLSADARAKGCAFGIELPISEIGAAVNILRYDGIQYRAIRDKETVL